MSEPKVLTKAGFNGEVMCPACHVARQPFSTAHHGHGGPCTTVGREFFCTTPECGYVFKATLTVEGKRKVADHEDHSV